MSDEVYAKVAKVDVGMANAYKKALGTAPGAKINLAGAKAIFAEVIDGLTAKGKAAITTNEAHALNYLLKVAPFTPDAVDFLAKSLVAKTASKNWVILEAMFEGGAAKLLNETERKGVAQAIDIPLVQNIKFYSPGTGITFTPHHYFAIKQLIAEGGIEIFAVQDGGLVSEFLDTGAMYRSDWDRMYITANSNQLLLKVYIVHEATHAIQDWTDVELPSSLAIEADAYIAGAVALKSLKVKPMSGGAYEEAYKKAVPIVMAGNATLNNRDWRDAYRDVKSAVGAEQGYGNYETLPDKPGRNEKATLEGYVNKIKAASPSKAP